MASLLIPKSYSSAFHITYVLHFTHETQKLWIDILVNVKHSAAFTNNCGKVIPNTDAMRLREQMHIF